MKRYYVKSSWIFNLESMHDKLWNVKYDLQDGKLQFPLEIANTKINDFGDLNDLMYECDDLAAEAQFGPVLGKTYGRIKEIASWRVDQRYTTCLNNGMNEREAGNCFTDL